MTEENGSSDLTIKSVNVSILGKETDKALADVLRQLLRKPAEEAGSLIGDAIGIVGDRIKLKRELNAKRGIELVREKLELGNVDMKDITPPREEEVHLLMNGLSLTDDDSVREMWAGLFAKALEPDSGVTVERPFVSVLESLSPTDAKIIHFLAYATKELESVAKKEKHGGPIFWTANDPEIAAELQRRSRVIEGIEEQAGVLSLTSLEGGDWTDNLMRQGVIEIPPKRVSYWQDDKLASMEEPDLAKALDKTNEKIRDIEEAASRKNEKPHRLYRVSRYADRADFQFQVELSSFGRRLAEACGLL